jgi:ribosomal protein S7
MMNGRNNGKKLMAVRIVAHAFEIVRPPASSNFSRNAGTKK